MPPLILNAVALGLSVATFVLNLLGELEPSTAISLLSLALFALALSRFQKEK